MTEPQHLWEAEHAYYCNDGNYLKNGFLDEHASWVDFAGDNEAHDFDLNLLFRWDWRIETDDDDEPTPAGLLGKGTLKLYWMQQRRGLFTIDHIAVGPEDEAAVRAWLDKAWAHMRGLWAPLEGSSCAS